MVHYKLTYFDLRGIAESIRLIFHYLEIPFDDVRIKYDDWESMKPSKILFRKFQCVAKNFQQHPRESCRS